MDYLIGFIIGYYWYRFMQYLKRLADNKILDELEKDF